MNFFLLMSFGAIQLVLCKFCVQYFLKRLSCYSSLVIPDCVQTQLFNLNTLNIVPV